MDARTSRYHEVYAAGSRPGGILGRGGARRSTGSRSRRRCSIRRPASRPLVPRRRLNTCYNAVDRHVAAGRGEQVALIYDSPVTGHEAHLHLRASCRPGRSCSALLRDLGVGKGDRVIIYMPMVPEAVIAMLACARHRRHPFGRVRRLRRARAGDPHRRRQAEGDPLGLLRHRGRPGRPLQAAARRGDRARAAQAAGLRDPAAAAVRRRRWSPGRDHDWREACEHAVDCASRRLRAGRSRPIRSTSSTPRARPASPRASCATMAATRSRCNWSMQNIYGVEPGEVFWAASDVGWVVGHSYIVYAPLLYGCTTVLYEGKPVGTPDAGAFWRVIARARGASPCSPRRPRSAPSSGRTRRASSSRQYDLSKFRTLFLAGERADPADRRMGRAACCEVPVIDHWWQTETGWPIAANLRRPRAAAGEARLGRRADAGLGHARARRRRQRGAAPARSARSW